MRVLLASQKEGHWKQKRPKMLPSSREMGRWQHFANPDLPLSDHRPNVFRHSRKTTPGFAGIAELRRCSGFSPKPCRTIGSGGRRSGGWAARVADFGDPFKAICPTGPWNGDQHTRFWRNRPANPALRLFELPVQTGGQFFEENRILYGKYHAMRNGSTAIPVPVFITQQHRLQRDTRSERVWSRRLAPLRG